MTAFHHFISRPPKPAVPMARFSAERATSTSIRFSSRLSSACVSLSCASRTSSVELTPALKRSVASISESAAALRLASESSAAAICDSSAS